MSALPQARRFRRLHAFVAIESAGGILMLMAMALAMGVANSPLSTDYTAFTHLPVTFSLGRWGGNLSLAIAVQDILMALFFLTVGLELKREWMDGVLQDRAQALLPFLAAVGGMVVPAAMYLMLNAPLPAHGHGWAIPTATDIAFALAVLMLASRRVPFGLKIFLLAIAIFDDLGAILVIALFYSEGVTLAPLAGAGALVALLWLLNRAAVQAITPYILLGMALWVCLHAAGIHSTIAGVLVGMAIPLRDPDHANRSPLNHCLHALHPWVNFAILPLFAFVSAGVDVRGLPLSAFTDALPLGIALALLIGKPLGILGASWLAINLGVARLPEGARWNQLFAVSVLAGIGFTMSLFIGGLAFDDPALHLQAKLGVLMGSLSAALIGGILARLACR